jgi:hypothetical protein
LVKNVISETGGDFGDLLKALLLPTVEFEAYELKESLSGAGTDEAALVEIICSKSNAQMMELRNTYKRRKSLLLGYSKVVFSECFFLI